MPDRSPCIRFCSISGNFLRTVSHAYACEDSERSGACSDPNGACHCPEMRFPRASHIQACHFQKLSQCLLYILVRSCVLTCRHKGLGGGYAERPCEQRLMRHVPCTAGSQLQSCCHSSQRECQVCTSTCGAKHTPVLLSGVQSPCDQLLEGSKLELEIGNLLKWKRSEAIRCLLSVCAATE